MIANESLNWTAHFKLRSLNQMTSDNEYRWYSSWARPLEVFIRAWGGVCAYCQRPVNAGACQVDHIHPKNKGGSNKLSNLTLSCRRCNIVKGDKTARNRDFLMSRAEDIANRIRKANPEIYSKRSVGSRS